jgi:hypothetical protein
MLNGEKPARTEPVRVEATPGTKFAYSNGGYLVLYLLIEDVTGESFADYMKRAVLDPIGMEDSTFDSPLQPRWAKRAATSYDDAKTPTLPDKFVEPNLAAGGLWTTPTDLAKFLLEIQREYAGTSHRVVHQQTIRTMLIPGIGPAPTRRWGLGFEVGGSPDNPYVRHEGSAYFQDDMVAYLRGAGIVVMTSGGGGGTLAEELLRSAATVYGFPDFKPIERSPVSVDQSSLGRLVGVYDWMKVGLDGSFLTAEIPTGSAPERLYAESPMRFFVLDGPQELEFHIDDRQNVTSVEFITPMGHHPLKKNREQGAGIERTRTASCLKNGIPGNLLPHDLLARIKLSFEHLVQANQEMFMARVDIGSICSGTQKPELTMRIECKRHQIHHGLPGIFRTRT